MTELLGVTPTVDRNGGGFLRYRWEPNARTRITFESHPEPGVLPGTEGFTPRHHGEHFHVQIRPDASVGWNNRRVIKIEPPEYEPGSGRAFLPGETFPGVGE